MRPTRSVLSIPGSNLRMIEKGLGSAADIAFLDLEDAISPPAKAEARTTAIDAVNNADWRGKPRAVRINAIGTPWFARDLVDLLEQSGDRLDLLIVPKVDNSADVQAIERLLRSLEAASGRSTPVHLEAQIETANGLRSASEIAVSSARVESLVYGPGDMAASLRMPGLGIGTRSEWDDTYGGDRSHHLMLTILIAARSAGIRAVDGPYADFRDPDGLRASARRSRSLGFDGKWCIHPAQIEIVNEVFSPTPDELERAAAIVAAWAASTTGALVHNGVMIDAANVRMAQATLRLGRANEG